MSGIIGLSSPNGGKIRLKAEDNLTTTEDVVIPEGGFLGYGQTWQDVTSSRQLDTTYTNDTGKPIMISVIGVNNGRGHFILKINGIDTAACSFNDGNGYRGGLAIIIPNGSTYLLKKMGSGVSVHAWSELR